MLILLGILVAIYLILHVLDRKDSSQVFRELSTPDVGMRKTIGTQTYRLCTTEYIAVEVAGDGGLTFRPLHRVRLRIGVHSGIE